MKYFLLQVVDYGWLGLFPISLNKDADIIKTLKKMVNTTYGYRSKFSHSEEHIEPGYYRVLLKTYDILAEITATDHVL